MKLRPSDWIRRALEVTDDVVSVSSNVERAHRPPGLALPVMAEPD